MSAFVPPLRRPLEVAGDEATLLVALSEDERARYRSGVAALHERAPDRAYQLLEALAATQLSCLDALLARRSFGTVLVAHYLPRATSQEHASALSAAAACDEALRSEFHGGKRLDGAAEW